MLNYKDFIHPEDDAARRNLEAIPGFSTAVKAFMRVGYEQYQHGVNLASKIKLSERQLPHLYNKVPPICKKLSIKEPDVYLEMDPRPNAYTYGDSRVFLTITSGLVEHLTDNEIDTVIAHECGHIACHHVLYHTMANLMKTGADMLGLLGVWTKPIQLALLNWYRKSELSADRAAAAAVGNPKPVLETMIRLSGGSKAITGSLNFEEYAAQAQSYEKLQESIWNKFLQSTAVSSESHPFTAIRVREIMKWCETEDYKRLVENVRVAESGVTCTNCKQPIDISWNFCKHCGTKMSVIYLPSS